MRDIIMHATTAPLHRPTVVLTPKGAAVLAFLRWLDAVRDLDAADQSAVLALAEAELEAAD